MVWRSPWLRAVPALLWTAVCCLTTVGVAADADDDAGPSAAHRTWLHRLGRFRLPDGNERNHPDVRAAFRDLVHNASQSTVRILGGGVQVALGTVVRSDGLILSKASELDDRIECCLTDGRRLEAQVLATDTTTDLALLKINAHDLLAVEWSDAELPAVGSLLATAGLDNAPAAIGVVSSPAHAVPQPRPVLGVGLENSNKGPRIDRIVPRSPAAKAGLQVGDVVVRIEEQLLQDRESLIAAIEAREPGQPVQLSVLREQKTLSITAVLGDLSHIGNPEQAELMDSLGGPLSQRRFGFPAVVQHDTVLRPRDCGGPVVGLDGKVVGMNIARASRVASYALPASSIRPVLEKLMQKEAQMAHEGRDLAPVSIKP